MNLPPAVRRSTALTATVLAVIASLLVLATSALYFRFDPDGYFEPQRLTYVQHHTELYLHITGAVIALAVLLAQRLIGRPRRHRRTASARPYPARPGVHRTLGRVYAGAVAAGGVGGLGLSFVAHGGPVARAGFAGLALAWLSTTGLGVLAALRHDRDAHRRWMIRSAALTFAAVTLRLYLGGYAAVNGGVTTDQAFADAYAVIAWICWLPNLALAWWFTRRPTQPHSARAPHSRRLGVSETPERLPHGARAEVTDHPAGRASSWSA